MAGKQKYGRGISLGLLEIDSCSLARELKSDPDTSIGDEIRRIILTKNESYALVACTEHTSSYTCFVVFKLETITNEQSLLTPGSMTNCTMILTRFDSDPNNTFSINDDQQILTILRTNQILIWKLNDGEILFNYDFHHLNSDNKIQQILNCQMNNNRLLILVEQGLVHIWDATLIMEQFSLIATISDPLVSLIQTNPKFPLINL
jgi:WD40 repeat protein